MRCRHFSLADLSTRIFIKIPPIYSFSTRRQRKTLRTIITIAILPRKVHVIRNDLTAVLLRFARGESKTAKVER